MRYDKLYGFYHDNSLETYLDARFSEIAAAGIPGCQDFNTRIKSNRINGEKNIRYPEKQ